ncbi:hypothetical protein [Rhizobium laguerreae]|uniref:hypothetical protein n=1 Tax=Rhizobium laguerreae TaxID=1076926 RepID=UPI0013F16150|nr:hypothetical protein [Rhizobium laguerreae]
MTPLMAGLAEVFVWLLRWDLKFFPLHHVANPAQPNLQPSHSTAAVIGNDANTPAVLRD